MALSGVRKAALLLRGLEPATAGELLKAARPETLTRIAAELVYLDATGQTAGALPARTGAEFLGLLRTGKGSRELRSFVRNVVTSAVGEEKSEQVLGEIHRLVEGLDPFIPVRAASAEHLAQTLEGQHPQVAAIVLMELAPEKSARLLGLLDESVRADAVRRMTCGDPVSPEAQARVAAMIRSRLDVLRRGSHERPAATPPDVRLRHVALLLRNTKQELRRTLLETITQQDPELATTVQNLMVTWEDIPILADRSLQDVLRTVEVQPLALALQGAGPQIEAKVRSNVSERARAMIDEEVSLMRKPKAEDIEAARQQILEALRQFNASGELQFEEAKEHATAAGH